MGPVLVALRALLRRTPRSPARLALGSPRAGGRARPTLVSGSSLPERGARPHLPEGVTVGESGPLEFRVDLDLEGEPEPEPEGVLE